MRNNRFPVTIEGAVDTGAVHWAIYVWSANDYCYLYFSDGLHFTDINSRILAHGCFAYKEGSSMCYTNKVTKLDVKRNLKPGQWISMAVENTNDNVDTTVDAISVVQFWLKT